MVQWRSLTAGGTVPKMPGIPERGTAASGLRPEADLVVLSGGTIDAAGKVVAVLVQVDLACYRGEAVLCPHSERHGVLPGPEEFKVGEGIVPGSAVVELPVYGADGFARAGNKFEGV